jgi:prophage tail gpP-like protein
VAEELTREKPNVVLKVDGVRYEGWTGLRARRSMETIAGSFHLSVTENWVGQPARPIRKFQPCQLLLNDQPVITGYVDDVDPEYEDKKHTISVRGRCKTADLVDCSAIYKSGQWTGRKIEQIAANLCEPFGIKVITEVDTGVAFASFNIQQGETVFECLERAARMRALLLISDVYGNLVITRAGTQKLTTRLVQRENILGAKGKFSGKDQYSHYIVKGQSRGSDDWFGEKAAQGKAEVRDLSVPRYRPLIVVTHDQGSGTSLHDRAVWERNVRMGRGSRAAIPVQGWSHADGIWMPNKMVDVIDPFLDLNTEMLIAAVDYSIDDAGGTRAENEVVRREAFELVEGVRLTRLNKKLYHKDRRERKRRREPDSSFWAFDFGDE